MHFFFNFFQRGMNVKRGCLKTFETPSIIANVEDIVSAFQLCSLYTNRLLPFPMLSCFKIINISFKIILVFLWLSKWLITLFCQHFPSSFTNRY